MTNPQAPQAYDSAEAFYQDVYSHVVREVRPSGRTGAVMMLAEQTAGDWSDAPTPDLVISVVGRRGAPGTIDLGAGRFRGNCSPGSFVVISPGTATTILMDGAHDVRFLAVPYAKLLTLAGEDAGLPIDGDFGAVHAGLQRNRQIPDLLDRLWREAGDGSPYGAMRADGLLLHVGAALLQLRDVHNYRVGPGRERGGLAPWQVKRVLEYLEARLPDDVTLAELAAVAHLSPAHFCRAFKQSTGRSPLQQLIAMRIERAKALLDDPRLPVIEVAAACGYDSPSRFAQVFKRETGTSPSEWRRERLS